MTASIFLCELGEAGQQQKILHTDNTLMQQHFIMIAVI